VSILRVMNLKIRYELLDHGSAKFTMCADTQAVVMIADYIHDTLLDLITAANLFAKGAPEARVIVMDLPGKYEVILHSADRTMLTVEVRCFESRRLSIYNEQTYQIVFQTTDTVANFVLQVYRNASRILATHGLDGYEEKWRNDAFPLDAFERLKAVLRR